MAHEFSASTGESPVVVAVLVAEVPRETSNCTPRGEEPAVPTTVHLLKEVILRPTAEELNRQGDAGAGITKGVGALLGWCRSCFLPPRSR